MLLCWSKRTIMYTWITKTRINLIEFCLRFVLVEMASNRADPVQYKSAHERRVEATK